MAQEVVLLCRVKDLKEGAQRFKELREYFINNFVRMEVVENSGHVLEERFADLLKQGGVRIYIV